MKERKMTRKQAEEIALNHFGIATLQTYNRDSVDFHDVSSAGILAALQDAYEAGRKSVKGK